MSERVLRHERGALRVRGRALEWGARTYVMGIVNVSPDSFSGDGDPHAGAAAARALRQLDDHKVRAAFVTAMEAAAERSKQLASGIA